MNINGLKVVDATKRLTIHITQNDVVKGAVKDPGSCAAARACLREGGCTAARVHLGRTYLKVGKKWVRFLTPRSLRTEIISFDRGALFQPGEYTLSPLPPAKKTGKGQGSNTSRTKPRHKQKMRAKYHTVSGVRPHGANR